MAQQQDRNQKEQQQQDQQRQNQQRDDGKGRKDPSEDQNRTSNEDGSRSNVESDETDKGSRRNT